MPQVANILAKLDSKKKEQKEIQNKLDFISHKAKICQNFEKLDLNAYAKILIGAVKKKLSDQTNSKLSGNKIEISTSLE